MKANTFTGITDIILSVLVCLGGIILINHLGGTLEGTADVFMSTVGISGIIYLAVIELASLCLFIFGVLSLINSAKNRNGNSLVKCFSIGFDAAILAVLVYLAIEFGSILNTVEIGLLIYAGVLAVFAILNAFGRVVSLAKSLPKKNKKIIKKEQELETTLNPNQPRDFSKPEIRFKNYRR